MISLLIIGFIASTCAVPHFDGSWHSHHHEHHHPLHAPCQNNQSQIENVVNKFLTDFDKRTKDLDNKLTVWTDFDKRMKDLDNKLSIWTDIDKKMKDLDNKLNIWNDIDKKMKDLDNKLTVWTDIDKKIKDLGNKLTVWTDIDKKMKDLDNKLTVCTDFDKRVKDLDNKLTEFQQHYHSSVSEEGIVGNEYIITIPLSGFERKDIIVKAHEGYVNIQANHKNSDGNENIYSNFRTLPAMVKLDGKWTYEGGVLKITFPLNENFETQTVESVSVITTAPTTELPTTNREDVTSTTEENFILDERSALPSP